MCNFSWYNQYIVNHAGDENKDNHQLDDIVQWCNTKFCELTLKEMYGSQSVSQEN